VLTNADAAALLRAAIDRRGRSALLRTLGFKHAAIPLDANGRQRLGLTGLARHAAVAAGQGALRVLVVDAAPELSLRDAAGRVAARVSARAPELLWVILAASRGGEFAIAIPAPGGGQPAVALLVNPATVGSGDAESLASLAGACGESDVGTHLRWRETLGRDALTRRFYAELERAVCALGDGASGNADAHTRRVLSLRCASRLLFLAFLEAKGWLDEDRAYLSRRVARQGANLHRQLLDPLFFGSLNTPWSRRAPAARALGRLPFLNGGLFTRDALEKRHRHLQFADADIARVVGDLLGRYRVTAHEESAEFAEAAVDPEMLGRAFESLMASDDRRSTGAFYTPPAMIRRITDIALDAWSERHGVRGALDEARLGHVSSPEKAAALHAALSDLRLLDPACGTGAFLVHAMHEISRLLAASRDGRPEHERRRAVLAQSLFGVDVNPTAVWLCELRLWLAVTVDGPERDPLRVAPLPNLDRHIRCADALSGPAFDIAAASDGGVAALRGRYARATGRRKQALQQTLERAERALAVAGVRERLNQSAARRRDLLCALRGHDLFGARRVATATERAALADWRREAHGLRRALAALRAGGAVPFSFASHFGDAAQRGGFDVIVGNPPWVRLHRIAPTDRDGLRARYESMRNAAWRAGAASSGALTGFGMQADLAALFTERAVTLSRGGGVAALLVPSKLLRTLAGGGLRAFLTRTADVLACEDHAAGHALFDAATYPAILALRRRVSGMSPGSAAPPADVACCVVRRDAEARWRTPPARLAFDSTAGAPWLLLPPPVRAAFDALAGAGTPLAESLFGRPMLGVKSGCNEAFVVSVDGEWQALPDAALCAIRGNNREGRMERALLRPMLRGEDLAPFAPAASSLAILWTHDRSERPLTRLPPHAERWLAPHRLTLARRSDVRHQRCWWSLFRLDAAAPRWRVVWGDVGRTPRAMVLAPHDDTVPLNSCYVVHAPSEADADALAVWLNAPITTAWLTALAEPARGGYHRFLGWTMARLPVPSDWVSARALLAPLGRAGRRGQSIASRTLHEVTLRAGRLSGATLEPLLTWAHW
jgi:hypothetical protein